MAVREDAVSGWRALVLEGEELSVTVLPDKGADIYSLVDLESELDVLFKTPWGLQPPGSEPREGSGDLEFLHNYEGGWQELFPSVNGPCVYRGAPIPFHGEVATLPWEAEEVDGGLRCTVACRRTPFRLERSMSLDGPALALEERVVNEGEEPAHCVWGHHCVVGPPFLQPGCRLRAPARTLVTIPELWEETARLEPGQRSTWPNGRRRDGGTADLSHVPGPDEGSHDDVYLTDLDAGWVAVENPALGRTFALAWDAEVYPWVISWQPYGGAEAMPLAGCYALGVEPWVSRLDLAEAVRAEEAVELAPGESLRTKLTATIERGEWRP